MDIFNKKKSAHKNKSLNNVCSQNKLTKKNRSMTAKKEIIALIAGNGKLPLIVADQLNTQKKNFIILCFDQNNSKTFLKLEYSVHQVTLENIKNIISIIKEKKVSKVVCCGGMRFPGIKNLKLLNIISPKIFKCIIKTIFAKQKGDNFLFLMIEKIFNIIGCEIIPVQNIVPNILCNESDDVNAKKAKKYTNDISYGINILNTLSKFDIGQAIVVQNGRTIGLEGAEGTAELIKRCGHYCNNMLKNETQQRNKKEKKTILIKMCKINQSKKIDVPTIGVNTVKDAIKNNFEGIVIENKSVIILDRKEIKDTIKNNKDKFVRKNFFIKVIK